MRITRLALAAGTALALAGAPAAFAAAGSDSGHHHDTAKGAAVGALAGHEVGSGHAVAGAGVGAAAGHHHAKKTQKKNSQ